MTEYLERQMKIWAKYQKEIEEIEKEFEKIKVVRTLINTRNLDWNKQISEILNEATKLWIKYINKKIEKISDIIILPKKIFGLDNGFIMFYFYTKNGEFLIAPDIHLYMRISGVFGETKGLYIWLPNLVSTRILKDYIRKRFNIEP
jgi:hypothetical protein